MDNQWYVHTKGQQLGPYPWEELRRKAASYELAPSDHVWNQSLSGWVPAEQVPGLFPAQAQAPPPPPAAPYSAPAPVYSPSGPPLQPKRGVNTGLIAAVLVFLLLVGGGTAIYWFYIKGRGGPAIGSSMGNDIVGAWYGVEDEEDGYIQFLNDGTMIMAIPPEGFWLQNPYRLVEDGGQLFLEVYDDYFEEWERDLKVSFSGKNSLNLTYIWDGDTITLERVSEQQFQEVLGQLEFMEY